MANIFEEKNKFIIFVVDDDRAIRLALRHFLENDGYAVVEAENGAEALAAYDGVQPDLILMDCMMPVMDGFTACSRIRELYGSLRSPVLMITGFEDDKLVDMAFEAGASDFVSKPIHWAVLRQRVRRLLLARQSDMLLDKANRKLQDIIEFLPDATFVIDHEKKVIAWNRAIEEMTGILKEDIIGRGDFAYAVPFYGDPRPILIDCVGMEKTDNLQPYQNVEKKGNTLYAEIFAPALSGGRGAYLWVTASPLFDSRGTPAGAIESIRDITERKRMEEKNKYLILHDPLTGLYNRTYFERELRRMEMEKESPVGVIACDVDGLKLVNDTLGHDTGDMLLMVAAGILNRSLRDDDLVARVGGDEFAVLLPGGRSDDVSGACRRIVDAIKRHNRENPKLPLNISLGFAVGEKSRSLAELFREADNNMYREKLHRSQSARSAIVKTLMKALEARDYITEGHAERLQNLVVILAENLGFAGHSLTDLRLLAQFHDIGKVGIPDRILFKKGPLTAEEAREMHRHCEIGHRIAQSAPDLAPIADWILKHHEWWNGSGYPLKLRGEEIPVECRILSIADAYDAMTSDRPYRKAMEHKEAVAELKRYSGIQFDPRLVPEFLKVI